MRSFNKMGRLFGTDGVRGIANTTIACETALDIGRAAANVIANGKNRPVFVVGTDTRISSDLLCAAAEAGLCSAGADVIHLGVIPTPAVAYLAGKYRSDAGMVISASHNPYQYNGIKLFSSEGSKLPDELEEQIEQLVTTGSAHIDPRFDAVGRIRAGTGAVEDYIGHICQTVSCSLEGMKIAVDCANGAASVTARRLLSTLGADAEIINATPDGMNINFGCGSTNIEALSSYVKGGGYDAGIAFDGDGDRCLAVDERGETVDGDMMMAIFASDLAECGRLAKNTVVGTLMSNYGLERFCEEHGLKFLRTRVGDRFVFEEMQLGGYNFGGEQSGHIIFRDFSSTGDGQLTAVQLLSLMRRHGKKLSELDIMRRYPQIERNIPVTPAGKINFFTDPEIKEAIETSEMTLAGHGRIVVRPSGTEPLIRIMVEGEDEKEINGVASAIYHVIVEKLGVMKEKR